MVGVFLLVVGAYYAFAATDLYKQRVFHPYLALNAELSGGILVMLGQDDIDTRGTSISSPKFSLSIGRGCDGMEPMSLFVAALLAFPAPWILRLPAILICLPLLAAFNLVRIVSLYFVGAYYPSLFDAMHADVWQVLYILFGVALFALWLAWATRTTPSAPG
jgi:exosortase/archaeosortase family protein